MSALLFLAIVSMSSTAVAADKHNWISATDKNIDVRAQKFAGSDFTPAAWARFLKRNGDPLGKRNRFFRLEVHDKRSGKTHKVPMIPADKLAISPHSRFVVVLSSSYPSDGVVVLSRDGKIMLKEFSLCLRETCTVSNYRSAWFDKSEIEIVFSDDKDGRDCLLTIAASKTDPRSQRLLFNVCKAGRPARNTP